MIVVMRTGERYFNPHSPCGERQSALRVYFDPWEFQSTLPLRGATDRRAPRRRIQPNFNPHSPCGERHGRAVFNHLRNNFNPHSPCGERLSHPRFNPRTITISIHTPLAGSDAVVQRRCRVRSKISIHTPLAGSDFLLSAHWRSCKNFNPHSPCGERHRALGFRVRPSIFQSTLPLRGATITLDEAFSLSEISIHTPLAGSDRDEPSSFRSSLRISIHTPLAGSDRRNETFLTK